MNRLSVIIPSKNRTNLEACVQAIREHEPTIGRDLEQPIIIVDDFEDDQHHPLRDPSGYFMQEGEGVVWCESIQAKPKPFVFARNINLGIRAADEDSDLILLNDDALLKTPSGISAMHLSVTERPEFGIVSASCNNAGNRNQFFLGRIANDRTSIDRAAADSLKLQFLIPQAGALRVEPRTLCFICVLIPRRTIEAVGLMDERFGGIDDQGNEIYGFCDDDMCLRTRQAGLKLGIYDAAFFDHGSLPSSFRADRERPLEPGQRQFILKHGMDNWGRGRATSPYRDLFPPEESA